MQDSRTYPLSPKRYPMAAIYLVATLVNCVPMQTFSSINVAVEKLFEISSTQVTLNALLFNVAHPLFAFLCNWLLNRYGMHKCFILGGLFVIGGVWLRLLVEVGNSTFLLLGSALTAFGNIFIINTPSKFATNWFPSSTVNLITFLGVSFTMLSVSIGASIPGFFINQNTSTVDDVRKLLLIEGIVVSIPIILLMIFFRDHPEHPPSKAAQAIVNQKRENYRHLLKKLFKNKQYLKLLAAAAFNNGTLNSILAILDQAIKGFGYENSSGVVSKVVLSVLVVGLITNPLFSILLKKTNAYRLLTGASALGSFVVVSLTVTAFMYQVNTTAYLVILGGMIGLFIIPLLSMFIMYGSQLAFPIDEGSSAGYIMASCQTFGFLVGFAGIRVLDKSRQRSQLVFFTLCGFLLLSFLISLWVKEDLKKLQYEQGRIGSSKQNLSQPLFVPQKDEVKG